jgi:radical SAM superfamily enzyme YgiQ (UPF0313 family)
MKIYIPPEDHQTASEGIIDMRILLIYPHHNPHILAPTNFEPLSLEILASTVPNSVVNIVDLRFEPISEVGSLIDSYRPDIAGITVNNTIQVNKTKEIINFIREKDTKIRIIVGGHHVSLMPEDFFIPSVNAVFLGWAEISFPQYVECLRLGKSLDVIPGVIILQDGLPINQPKPCLEVKPENIPLPDRDLTKKYRNRYTDELKRKTALVNTSRSCPYRCSFCACWKAARGRYLARSAESVFEELTMIPSDISCVFFADDNTFFCVRRARELYHLIKESGIRKKYSGYCRTDTVVRHPDLFRLWKEIGLENLTLGFEATSDKRLRSWNKDNSIETNRKAILILRSIGLDFSSYFMIDPDFEEKDFRDILEFVKQNHLIKPRFVILTPLPGTALYEKRKSKINLSYDFFDFMHWVYPTRMKEKDFFKNFAKLYYESFSYKRHLMILWRKWISRIRNGRIAPLSNLPLFDLVMLRIMAYPLRRKLHRQYFSKRKSSFLVDFPQDNRNIGDNGGKNCS